MSIMSHFEKMIYPGEKYILEKRMPTGATDMFESIVEDWQKVAELTGIIQKPSHDPQSTRGEEELAEYFGAFIANFEIPEDDFQEYRVKNIIPLKIPFIRYFRFKILDRNLRRNNHISHYEATMELIKVNNA